MRFRALDLSMEKADSLTIAIPAVAPIRLSQQILFTTKQTAQTAV